MGVWTLGSLLSSCGPCPSPTPHKSKKIQKHSKKQTWKKNWQSCATPPKPKKKRDTFLRACEKEKKVGEEKSEN
jgi:transposase